MPSRAAHPSSAATHLPLLTEPSKTTATRTSHWRAPPGKREDRRTSSSLCHGGVPALFREWPSSCCVESERRARVRAEANQLAARTRARRCSSLSGDKRSGGCMGFFGRGGVLMSQRRPRIRTTVPVAMAHVAPSRVKEGRGRASE